MLYFNSESATDLRLEVRDLESVWSAAVRLVSGSSTFTVCPLVVCSESASASINPETCQAMRPTATATAAAAAGAIDRMLTKLDV